MPYLTSVIYESLRLFPPISQLVNRRAASPTLLASSSNQESEIYIPQGTYIGYNCYATNRDTTVWGPTADDFMPERWGATHAEISRLYRSKRARAEFVSFHGGNRACLGEQFAVLEMRVSLCVLVRRFEWRLDSGWRDRKTPVSHCLFCTGSFRWDPGILPVPILPWDPGVTSPLFVGRHVRACVLE